MPKFCRQFNIGEIKNPQFEAVSMPCEAVWRWYSAMVDWEPPTHNWKPRSCKTHRAVSSCKAQATSFWQRTKLSYMRLGILLQHPYRQMMCIMHEIKSLNLCSIYQHNMNLQGSYISQPADPFRASGVPISTLWCTISSDHEKRISKCRHLPCISHQHAVCKLSEGSLQTIV